ncbi:MAG TPA: sialidase family protein [Candidatus Hydrogenedentes bacterium]|nr:sialidase family protein [Candidatus Hydrogenedentota bacterium]HRT19161.1 sialidase family protein [Candidatus Hydrogenedentota bacterium]HRT64090.1 sialidase family protein [Candidatus Hydrogenedentota bacterium]
MWKKCVISMAAFYTAACAAAATFEDVHVVPLPKGVYGYRGMPGSMIALKDGRILLCYTRILPDGHADGSIAARTSPDKGATWGDEFVLVERPKPGTRGRYCHPSLLRLKNGDLLLSYIYASGSDPLFGHNYYRRSDDDGQTWGDQLIVTPKPGYHIMHNDKLVQLSTGRILAPLEYRQGTSSDDHAGYVAYTFYSDDDGYSWHSSDNVVDMLPVEAQEAHGVELKDGRVMMLMRTYSGYVARAYSADYGKTWSKGEAVKELRLPPNSSALNVQRIPATGDLLLVRSSDGPKEPPHRRTPFVSVLSKDDGATWTDERVIAGDPEDDYGYPSLMFVEDLALISYHQRDGLHVARIGIDWFYGK